MVEFLAMLGFIIVFCYIVSAPADTNSTSYKVGKGVGNKARKFGEWLTRDD
jgi:hypothetical protein